MLYNILTTSHATSSVSHYHDDVIKWKHFPRYWPFVREIHRSPVNSPIQRPVTRSFDIFFDLRLNKRLSKQSWGWWFETPSWSLWRHCNDVFVVHYDVPNHRQLDCLFKIFFRIWTKTTSKLRTYWPLWEVSTCEWLIPLKGGKTLNDMRTIMHMLKVASWTSCEDT